MQISGGLGTHLHSVVSKCDPSTQSTFWMQIRFALEATASLVTPTFDESGSGAPLHPEKTAADNKKHAQIGLVFIHSSSSGVVADAPIPIRSITPSTTSAGAQPQRSCAA